MKGLLFAFITFISIQQTIAQANGKLTISAFFSPDISYRSLSSKDSLSTALSQIKNDYESSIYTYTTGINISRKLFSAFAIETGLNYNKRGYVYDSSSATGDYNLSTTYVYNFLQIPVRLKIYIPFNRWNFYIGGGVSGMMMLDALKSSIETKNGIPTMSTKKLKTDMLKRFNYNMVFSIGLDYRITKRFYLKIEPSFSKTIESIRKDKLDTYLYSTGINFGFLYVVKKAK